MVVVLGLGEKMVCLPVMRMILEDMMAMADLSMALWFSENALLVP